MKILNLYSGLGGNRKLWQDCQVTAVEKNPLIADIYKNLFPKDQIIIADAHQYLLDYFQEFDFIWSSPPCQSHSSFRQNICVRYRGTKAIYPDMKLYQEILFLKYNFQGFWIVENVKPYYKPLIPFNICLQRHLFWTNINIPMKNFSKENIRTAQIKDLEKYHQIDLSSFKISNKRQLLRNCVHFNIGKYIFDQIS